MELILNVVFTVVLLGVLIFNVLDMRKRMRAEDKIREFNTERFFNALIRFIENQEQKIEGFIYCFNEEEGDLDLLMAGRFGIDDLINYEEYFFNIIDRNKYEVWFSTQSGTNFKLIDGDWRWSKHDCKADGYVPPKLKFKDGDE